MAGGQGKRRRSPISAIEAKNAAKYRLKSPTGVDRNHCRIDILEASPRRTTSRACSKNKAEQVEARDRFLDRLSEARMLATDTYRSRTHVLSAICWDQCSNLLLANSFQASIPDIHITFYVLTTCQNHGSRLLNAAHYVRCPQYHLAYRRHLKSLDTRPLRTKINTPLGKPWNVHISSRYIYPYWPALQGLAIASP